MDERNFTFMFYGFAMAWLILLGYVVALVARERKIKSELDNLKRIVEGKEHLK